MMTESLMYVRYEYTVCAKRLLQKQQIKEKHNG